MAAAGEDWGNLHLQDIEVGWLGWREVSEFGGMSKEKGLGFYFLALFNYIISLAEFYGASLE